MFGVLSKIAGFVWGDSSEETKPERDSGEFISKSQRNVSVNQRLQPERRHARKNRDLETPNLKKVCDGKVTHLYDGSGIIENDIYFTFDLVLGGVRPQLGEKVHVIAKRESETAGWKAVRVEVLTEWTTDHVFTGRDVETFIGSITKLSAITGVVNGEINFDLSCLRPGYIPYQGDWVKLDIERPSQGVIEVKSAIPLRERTFTGTVSSVSPGFGYIDDEVYFGVGACSRNYRPRRGDLVNVTAMESHQGRVTWRALKVEPKNNMLHSRLRPESSSQAFMGRMTAELVRDKEGVTVTEPIHFGDVLIGESRALNVWIRNTGDKPQIFHSCSALRDDPQFTLHVADEKTAYLLQQARNHSVSGGNKRNRLPGLSLQELLQQDCLLAPGTAISPGEKHRVVVSLQAKSLGRVSHLVVFSFQGFEIGRHLLASVKDPQELSLAPNTSYERSKRRGRYQTAVKNMNINEGEDWIIPGQRPTRKKKVFFPVKLKMYTIPRDIKRCILEDGDLTRLVPALGEPITMKNYQARFSTVLSAEELQMELDMREFDLERVLMNHCGEFLSLTVPGLAEGRPSLLIGDKVEVAIAGSPPSSPRYEGYIHEVRQEDILLKFHEEFHNKFSMQECDVMFFCNRATIRRAHQAVEFSASLGEEVLFPRGFSPKLPVVNLNFVEVSYKQGLRLTQGDGVQGESKIENRSKDPHSETSTRRDFLYNSNLNERQRAAVTRIVRGQCRPTPYLLFGPPGTGKTVTLVEAILQIFHKLPSSRILACAPSNSASDLIAERLHKSGFIQESDMVRLNALHRGQEVPEIISRYCADTDDLVLAAHYRVVICTCSTSGQLFSLGLQSGHFTHVFVDEAGQATEPECLIPVGLAAGGEGQVILAGDPFQLGPVLRSSVAVTFGLNISLLERLISRLVYCRDETKFADHGCYDPLLVTKLVNNYRSHPSLLHPCSTLFYHAELQVHADRTMRECLCDWEPLPNAQVPIIFHGMKGEDLREGNSPSWFNPVEAVQVTKYVQALRTSDNCAIKLADIGIITPYRKQVEKIRLLLDRLGLSDVKVGSVEEFQGQERLAVIISTVRSNESLVGFDTNHCIGFLSNPKRFNVAITRAQALLVIIGNPHVLCQDPHWCTLLHYCVMNDAYIGCDLPDLDQHLQDEDFRSVVEVLRAKSEESKREWIDSRGVKSTEVEDKVQTSSVGSLSEDLPRSPSFVGTHQIGIVHVSEEKCMKYEKFLSPSGLSKMFQEHSNLGLNQISLLEEEPVSGEDNLNATQYDNVEFEESNSGKEDCSSTKKSAYLEAVERNIVPPQSLQWSLKNVVILNSREDKRSSLPTTTKHGAGQSPDLDDFNVVPRQSPQRSLENGVVLNGWKGKGLSLPTTTQNDAGQSPDLEDLNAQDGNVEQERKTELKMKRVVTRPDEFDNSRTTDTKNATDSDDELEEFLLKPVSSPKLSLQ